ncbi:MAG: ribonuclease R [Bosea sp. (in: a-proteobacteria)]
MTRKTQAQPPQSDVPDREAVRQFLVDERAAGREPGKRDVARAFGITGGGKIWLKRILKELQAEETALSEAGVEPTSGARPNQRDHGDLPPVLVAEIRRIDAHGDFIAEPAEWDVARKGPAPAILVHLPRKLQGAEKLPGIGDRALMRIEPNGQGDDEPLWRARVLKLFSKAPGAIGVFRSSRDGGGRLIPIDKKARGKEIRIPKGRTGNAEDGDLIAVTLLRSERYGLAEGEVRERLGSMNSERAASLIAILKHDIPHVFSPAVLAEAESITPASLKGREDWRELPLVTIDPADAKDHDDAVHAAHDEDPANPGGFIVTVAIADVAAYVQPGSALDEEALKRGNSVYFPDRVVPMLPERLSNDLCSLKPDVDRPALAVRMVLNAQGEKKRHSFHRIMMRSAAKLAYPQAQAVFDGQMPEAARHLPAGLLATLHAAYTCAAKARDTRQPLELDLPERKLVLDDVGRVIDVTVPERLTAHRLIEEFMILANVAAAEELEKARQALIYRAHGEPSAEKLRVLGEVLASIGIKLPKQGALRPAQFNQILARIKGTEHEAFINEIVLRTQAQAEYTIENIGHFGLNLRRYAHFTSPIRRYSDLTVHRGLVAALHLGEDEKRKPVGRAGEGLRRVAEQVSVSERRAMAAERETTDRLIAAYLSEHVGAEFDGRVAGVNRAGLFVKLAITGADGFVPAATLGADYYAFDEQAHALIGSRSGEGWRLGDRVRVKLAEAVPISGELRFEMVTDGRALARSRHGMGRPQSHRGKPAGFSRGPTRGPSHGPRRGKSR